MGACFFQILKSCEVTVNCAVGWVHPANNKQYLIIGAEEGIYTLDLEELHENHLVQIYDRRCSWLHVVDDVMVALQGKTPYLYRHDILQLVQQHLHLPAITRKLSKQVGGLVCSWLVEITKNPNPQITKTLFQVTKLEVSERYKPKVFLTTVRIPETRDCFQCCVERSVTNGNLYMACAVPSAILLFQWYDPQAKFLLMRKVELRPGIGSRVPYQPFSLVFGSAAHNSDFPMMCIGVYGSERAEGVDNLVGILKLMDIWVNF